MQGTGGISIYGSRFEDENFTCMSYYASMRVLRFNNVEHNKRILVSALITRSIIKEF
jgi:hypothetical protein